MKQDQGRLRFAHPSVDGVVLELVGHVLGRGAGVDQLCAVASWGLGEMCGDDVISTDVGEDTARNNPWQGDDTTDTP